MKILILGAGQVGGTLAESLAQEAFDITLVDVDGTRLQELGMRLDIQTIEGSASHPDVLRRAGADDAARGVAARTSVHTVCDSSEQTQGERRVNRYNFRCEF